MMMQHHLYPQPGSFPPSTLMMYQHHIYPQAYVYPPSTPMMYQQSLPGYTQPNSFLPMEHLKDLNHQCTVLKHQMDYVRLQNEMILSKMQGSNAIHMPHISPPVHIPSYNQSFVSGPRDIPYRANTNYVNRRNATFPIPHQPHRKFANNQQAINRAMGIVCLTEGH